jgi:putative SOS response-associated peptidase YedK
MCGRYTLAVEMDELAERFGCPKVELVFKSRYNVAPTHTMPVIVGPDDKRHLQLMQWGLVPYWSKERSIGSRMINARIETAEQKPAFKDAFRRRRCLIPATGYHEWQKQGAQNQPFYIHIPGRNLFAFAGLWDEWKEPGGKILYSFTILTTDPVSSIAHLHNRMPYILPFDQESLWLQGYKLSSIENHLEAYKVSTLANKPANDLPACINPIN